MFTVGTTGASPNAYNGQPLRGPLNIPDSPPRLARRAPRKGNKRETLSDIARRVPVDVIRPYFNYPLRKAAEALSISVTTLKRLCRRHGVKRWPHRQLSGLNRAVSHLEAKRQAAKEGANDPVISDQLHQLYSRRDIVIDLAFMSDEEAAARGAEPVKSDVRDDTSSTGQQQRSARTGESGTGQIMVGSGGLSPEAMSDSYAATGTISWWSRDHSSSSPIMSGSGGRSSRGDGAGVASPGLGAGVAGHSVSRGGELCDDDTEGSGLGARRPDSSCQNLRGTGGSPRMGVGTDLGNGCAANEDENFRASSVLVRLPGLTSSGAPESMDGPLGGRKLKLPSPESLLAGIPSSSAAAAAARVNAASCGDAPRRPLSPMTIGPSKVLPQGGIAKSAPTRLLPLPPQYQSDTINKQIAELSALNDILFGTDTEDVNGLVPPGAGHAVGINGGGPHDLKGCIPVTGSTHRVSNGDVDGAGGGGGRLPSIAGLVAADALINGIKGEQWRSPRPGGSAVLIRGRTGEV